MFSTTTSSFARTGSLFSQPSTTSNVTQSPSGSDIEVPQAPNDTVQAIKFNPATVGTPIFLAAGSWDNTCRIWQVNENGVVEPKALQDVGAPILSIDWTEDSTKLFIASADKQARVWDLASNQVMTVGQHNEAISICHWISTPKYTCLMTGGWDKTLRFWDMRQLPTQSSLATVQLDERVYCSDMLFPMGVIGLGNRHIKVYSLEGEPREISDTESPLKFQNRCLSIFKNKATNQPVGYALGSIEGRVAIQYVDTSQGQKESNFTFKCHRSPDLIQGYQEIYAVNDVCFHPNHFTLVTIGSDGRYSFWDKDARTKLKQSEAFPLPITKCHINQAGNIFAYAIGYDWSKGHEGSLPTNFTKIYLHACEEEMKPRLKK